MMPEEEWSEEEHEDEFERLSMIIPWEEAKLYEADSFRELLEGRIGEIYEQVDNLFDKEV